MSALTCPECGSARAADALFCHRCGHTLDPPGCVACRADLPADALFCARCGAPQSGVVAPPTSPEPAVQPVTERRVTSVLFADLVGFTTVSETRDHEEVRDLLSRYFSEARLVIGRYGGVVEKFIGDAVMAVWGVPTAHDDDAERAVRSGLDLIQAVDALGEELGISGLALRVGVVTGEVTVTLGAEHQGMVAGDAVNTASRIQSVAEPDHVWVDETTRLLTSSAISYADAGTHPLKGKADPVPLWSARAVVAALGGAQRADGLEAPLVGRARELRLLKELFHGAEETATPTLVVVDGDPGVGKSRLGWEFEKYVDALTSTVRWHSGRCLAYGEGVAFFALAEAVRGRLAVAHPDLADTEDLTTLLDRGLREYVEDPQEREWIRPRLAVLLGLGADAVFQREDLFSAWTTFLQRVGAGKDPVALVVDDAQHADDGMLQFLEHLIGVDSFACFVLLLTRPGLLEDHPTLATNRRSTVVHLAVLPARDMASMLDGLVSGLPDAVRTELVRRAEGVPLFAIETVRSLIDRDLVVPRGGQYRLADSATLDLDTIGAPASLQALISARLDTLPPDLRRVVVQASVLGAAFPREALALLCPDVSDLDAALASLVRLQLLSLETSRLSSEYGQYQFVQTVVRQVGYSTLARRDRKISHLRVARMYESESDATGDLAPIIAQHYLDAIEAVPDDSDVGELSEAAVTRLRAAAQRSRSLGVPDEAAAHLTVALGRATDSATRARLEAELAWALVDAGRYPEGVDHARSASEALDALGDPVAAGTAAAAWACALAQGLSDNQAALAVAQPWWDRLAGRSDAAGALLALARTISAARQRLSLDNRDVLEARIRLAERLGDLGDLADSITELSRHYTTVGSSSLTQILLRAAADLAREHHRPAALARALSDLTADSLGTDLAAATAYGREAVAAAQAGGVRVWVSFGQLNLALALWARGDWGQLRAFSELERPELDPVNVSAWRVLAALVADATGTSWDPPGEAPSVEAMDDPVNRGWVQFEHAMTAQAAGDLEDALRSMMEAAETFFDLYGVMDDLPHVWPVAADLAIRLGRGPALERLLAMIDEHEDALVFRVGLRGHRAHARARAGVRDGQSVDEVERLFRAAVDDFVTWGSPPFRARAEADLAGLLAQQGRHEEAGSLRGRANEVFGELGAVGWQSQLENA